MPARKRKAAPAAVRKRRIPLVKKRKALIVPQIPAIHMGTCAKNYLHALTQPFNSSGACIPAMPPYPVATYSMNLRGTCTNVGINTLAYAVVGQGIAANNGVGVVFTDGNGAGETTVDTTAAVGIVEVSDAKGPLADADIGSGETRVRRVGLGIRMRYIGREDARGGSVIFFHLPFSVGVDDNTPATILATGHRHAMKAKVTREWQYLNWIPSRVADMNWSVNASGIDSATSESFGFVATNCAAGASFDWEVVCHVEASGPQINNNAWTSPDSIGLDAAMHAAQRVVYSNKSTMANNATKTNMEAFAVAAAKKDQSYFQKASVWVKDNQETLRTGARLGKEIFFPGGSGIPSLDTAVDTAITTFGA